MLEGPRQTWTVTPSTQHDTGRQRGRRNTRAWQIELAAVGVRRTEETGAGLLTQEWQRVTGHVKFMASPRLHGNTSPTGDWQAPHCETVVVLLKPKWAAHILLTIKLMKTKTGFMQNMDRLEKKLTSRSLKNKCVSAKLKIISSILRPSDTDVGGSWKNKQEHNHIKLPRSILFHF